MSAEHAYGDALGNIPGEAAVGLNASIEAINDGELGMAAEMLRTTADFLEGSENGSV